MKQAAGEKKGTLHMLPSIASTGFAFEIYEHIVIVLNE